MQASGYAESAFPFIPEVFRLASLFALRVDTTHTSISCVFTEYVFRVYFMIFFPRLPCVLAVNRSPQNALTTAGHRRHPSGRSRLEVPHGETEVRGCHQDCRRNKGEAGP